MVSAHAKTFLYTILYVLLEGSEEGARQEFPYSGKKQWFARAQGISHLDRFYGGEKARPLKVRGKKAWFTRGLRGRRTCHKDLR